MKKTKILVALTAVLLAIFMIAVAIPVFGSNVEPSLSIDGFNLSFEDNVYIKYAVKLNGTTAEALGSNFEMLFWTAPQTAYTKGSESFSAKSIGDETINNTSYEIFKYTELAAKNMTDDIYARAYMKIGESEYYSEIEKYSILQYAYNMLGKTDTATDNEDLKTLLNEMLGYGAAAQKYFNYKTDRLATDSYYQIKVVGGTLSDGMSNGLYKTGATVTFTAPATNADGIPFDHWENSAGASVGTELEYTATVSTKNEVYTAVFKRTASVGLEFTPNGDGETCYVSDIGTCSDTDIVIPEISPDGLTVIGIGDYAFENCNNLTSVTIGNGVTSLGYMAFSGCSAMKELHISSVEAWCKVSLNYNSYPFCSSTAAERNIYINGEKITDLVVPDSVTSIGDYAFRGCSGLTSIEIPDSITSIGSSAFYNCSGLTSVFVPDSVTSIGDYAFEDCNGLKPVYYGGTASDWSTNISIDFFNFKLTNATRYYYSETEPTESGNYWHYDENGVPTVW